MRLLAGAALLWAAAAAQGGAPPPPEARLLPALALDAAVAGPVPLAAVLARFDVPAGVVTSADPRDRAHPAFRLPAGAPRTVAARDVLARFAAAHPGHAVAWRDGVASLEETSLACRRVLAERSIEPAVLDGDVAHLLLLLAWMAGGQEGPLPGGTISFGVGRVPVPVDDEPVLPPLKVAFDRAVPLREAFDAVVRAAGGGAWIVWQHRRVDGTLGCRDAGFYPNGLAGGSSRDFAVIGFR